MPGEPATSCRPTNTPAEGSLSRGKVIGKTKQSVFRPFSRTWRTDCSRFLFGVILRLQPQRPETTKVMSCEGRLVQNGGLIGALRNLAATPQNEDPGLSSR